MGVTSVYKYREALQGLPMSYQRSRIIMQRSFAKGSHVLQTQALLFSLSRRGELPTQVLLMFQEINAKDETLIDPAV
jgi:hypothetical protein